MSDLTNKQLLELIETKIVKQAEEVKEYINTTLNSTLQTQDGKINKLYKENEALKSKVKDLEQHIRKNNILIFGIKEDTQEKVEEIVINHLHQHLRISINSSDVEMAYRIGKPQQQNRPILVKFLSLKTKQAIFKNCYLLKGTETSIADDLIKENQEERKILIKHMNEAKKEGHTAKIKGNRLIINKKQWTVEGLKKLEDDFPTNNEGIGHAETAHISQNINEDGAQGDTSSQSSTIETVPPKESRYPFRKPKEYEKQGAKPKSNASKYS